MVLNTVTEINMTKKDYINLHKRESRYTEGKKEALNVLDNYLKPFQEVLDSYIPTLDTVEEFVEKLHQMGYNEPFNYRNNSNQ